jgi:hypothetical protein
MSTIYTMDRAPTVTELTVMFANLKISPTPVNTPRKRSSPLLGLPAELRCIIYESLAPHNQSAAWHRYRDEPVYAGLLGTCKQVREEAIAEISRALEMYYRAYEKEWFRLQGQVITVAWIRNPNHVHVTLPHSVLTAPPRTGPGLPHWPIPLISVPFRRLSITFTRDSNDTPLEERGLYILMRSVVKAKPAARITHVHWGCNFDFDLFYIASRLEGTFCKTENIVVDPNPLDFRMFHTLHLDLEEDDEVGGKRGVGMYVYRQ